MSEMFDDFRRSWDQRDRIELERRTSGWYEAVVGLLADQPSPEHVRHAVQNLGEIDGDELPRAVRELAIRAIEDQRPAEFELMQMLTEVVQRSMGMPSPGHFGEDVHETLKAKVLEQSLPLRLQSADSLLGEGRITEALDELEQLAVEIDTLPAELRISMQSSELVRHRVIAELKRAQALFALDRLDESLAAYEEMMRRAAEAGQAGVGFFGELEFDRDGLQGIARVALRRGRPSAAAETTREVMRRRVAEQGQPQPADFNNLGKALLALGQASLALEQFGRARAATEPTPPNPHTRFGEADALRMLGDEAAAQRIYADALQEAVAADDWLSLAMYGERLVEAIALPEPADLVLLDAARRRALEQDATAMAIQLTTALLTAPAADRQDDLLDAARDAIGVAAGLDPSAPLLARLRVALARALLARPGRDGGEARALLDDALSTVGRLLNGTPIDARRSEIAGDWIDATGALIELLRESDPTAAFGAHESAKAPALVARLGGAAPPPEAGVVPADLLEREAALRRLALSLQDDGAAGAGSQAYRIERLTDVRRQLGDVEDRIAAFAPEYIRRRRGVPATPAEIWHAVSELREPPAAVISFFVDRDATTAFVLGPGGRVDDYRCDVGRGELEALAASMRRAFNGDAAGYPPIRRNRPWARDVPAWAELGPRLLGFTEQLDADGTIVIAPHGPLHLLPVHALRLPDGRFLAQRFAVSYIPTLTALEHLLAGRAQREGGQGDVYVAGVASRADAHPEYFERDAELFASPAWSCRSDIGPERASRDRVLAAVGSADVVHLTCHGEFAPREPARSGVLFSNGSERPPRALEELPPDERPPFLLSVSDLLAMRMQARLVTLRACSTGLQSMRNAGDEFDGLTRALLEAGAQSALVSLWNVDQRSSRELLERFYRHWTDRTEPGGAAQALALAQRELIDLGDPVLAHPYHWAPFALIGDWR